MNPETETKIIEHVDGYPERRKAMEAKFEHVEKSIGTAIVEHEQREFKKHNHFDKKLDRLEDKFDQAIIAARDSASPSFSRLFSDLNNKIDSLHKKVEPVVDIIDVTVKLRKGTIWLAGGLLAIYPIIEAVKYIKRWFSQ